LTTESKAVRPLAQLLPEHDLRKGQFAAEITGAANVRIRSADRTVPHSRDLDPSPMLRMVLLPVPGRIFVLRHAGNNTRTFSAGKGKTAPMPPDMAER
jgi:hypothetical protein